MNWLLLDEQSRFSGIKERYRRLVRRAVTDVGVDWLAEQRIEFNPSYHRVIIHHLRIHRGEEVIDALEDAEQDLVRIEPDIHMRVYCGAYVLITQIRALEPGDVLDFAYTVVGHNRALSGHVIENFRFAFGIEIGRRHARALVSMPIKVTTHRIGNPPAPQLSVDDRISEWRFDVVGLKGRAFEDAVPAEFDDQYDEFAFTSFESWADVASWAAQLYEIDERATVLDELVDRFRSARPEAPELAAIEYVQESVRYVAANFGEGGLRPRPLPTICSRRYGDCKDKCLLLTALLRRLGHRCNVALVNTDDPFGPLARPPGPAGFDHLIIRAEIDGAVCWIDPTMTGQVSPLRSRGRPHDAVALVVDPATSELVEIPPLEEGQFGEDTLSIHDLSGGPGRPVTISYESRYVGHTAESQRRYVRSVGLEEAARDFLDWETTLLGAGEGIGSFEIQDDEELNVLTKRWTIRFEQPWIVETQGTFTYRYPLCQANEFLPSVVAGKRRLPVVNGYHPFSHVHREEFVLPDGCVPADLDQERRSARNQAFSASRSASLEGNRYIVVADTHTHSRYVDAKEAMKAKRDEALLPIMNLVELDFPVPAS